MTKKESLISAIDKALGVYQNFRFENNYKFDSVSHIEFIKLTGDVNWDSLEECKFVNLDITIRLKSIPAHGNGLSDKIYTCNARFEITNYIPANIENNIERCFVGHITDAVINCR